MMLTLGRLSGFDVLKTLWAAELERCASTRT